MFPRRTMFLYLKVLLLFYSYIPIQPSRIVQVPTSILIMCTDCRRLDDKEWITDFFKTVHEQQSRQIKPTLHIEHCYFVCYSDSSQGSLLALGFHPELSWQYTVKQFLGSKNKNNNNQFFQKFCELGYGYHNGQAFYLPNRKTFYNQIC
jgi:hypothetical protein